MGFESWKTKGWAVVSDFAAPEFFCHGRRLRFFERGGQTFVESSGRGDGTNEKACTYREDRDELVIELDNPAGRCIVTRFVHSLDAGRAILVAEVQGRGGIGETGSWTALDGSGRPGDPGDPRG